MLKESLFPYFADMGSLHGYRDEGLWFDTGTFERLDQVRKMWKIRKIFNI